MQAVAPGVLGLVQRQVGSFQQLFAGVAVLGKQADADAGGHHHAPASQLDGLFHLLHDALGHLPGFVAVMNSDQNAEFIAAKACHYIFMAAYRALDMPGQHREQLVARIVAKAVIDALEVINVEKDYRQHALASGFFRNLFREDLIETTAVEQAGQCIEVGHLLQ